MTQAARKFLEEFDALQEGIRRRCSPNCCGALLSRRTICPILTTWCHPPTKSSSSSIGASGRSESATAGRGLACRPRYGRKGPPRRGDEHSRRRCGSGAGDDRSAYHQRRGSRFEAAVSVPFLQAGVFDAQNLVMIAKLIRGLASCPPPSWPS
jgi:hypothetical protein